MNYARRQQYRRLLRAGRAAVESAAAVLLALVVGGAKAWPLAGLLLLIAFGLGLYAGAAFVELQFYAREPGNRCGPHVGGRTSRPSWTKRTRTVSDA